MLINMIMIGIVRTAKQSIRASRIQPIRMKIKLLCLFIPVFIGVATMGQSSGDEKGALPPLKDLGIVDTPKEVVLKAIEFDGNNVFTDE